MASTLIEATKSAEDRLPQLLKKLPALYGTRRFITVFTTAFQLYPSSARLIQSSPFHSNIIFTPTHNYPQLYLSYRSPTKPVHEQLSPPIRATCPTYLIHRNNIWQYKQRSSSTCSFLQPAVPSSSLPPYTPASSAYDLPRREGPLRKEPKPVHPCMSYS
jgi:hypothetical protein